MTRRPFVLVGILLAALCAAAPELRAQNPTPTPAPGRMSAEAMFADAGAKERAVRKALDAPSPSANLLKALRTVVADYEALVRRFPSSGYSDDALWRAGILSRDGFNAFHDGREHATALRLLQAIPSRYPSSKFAPQAGPEVATLKASASRISTSPVLSAANTPPAKDLGPAPIVIAPPELAPAPVEPTDIPASTPAPMPPAVVAASTPAPAPPPASSASRALPPASRPASAPPPNATASSVPTTTTTPSAPAAGELAMPSPSAPIVHAPSTPGTIGTTPKLATIKDIRRAIVGDVVRVVIELDGEVTFRDERIENPVRVFVDLPATRTVPALKDQTLRFDGDSEPVKQVRVGRHANSTTRVVLEADGVTSYSVYALYNPFRLVIDCLRAQPASRATATSGVLPPSATTTPPPALAAAASPPVALAATPVAAPVAPLPHAVTPAPAISQIARTQLPPLKTRRYVSRIAVTPDVNPIGAALIAAAWTPPPAPAPIKTAPLATAAAVLPAAPKPTPAPPAMAKANAAAAKAAEVPVKPVTPANVSDLPNAAPPSRNLDGGFSIARQLGMGVSRIVIDPGHGGHDPGTKGGGNDEAELVLDVALRLEKLLQGVAGLEVVLTRRTDTFVTLQERTAIANRENADLFLSIHANASNAPTARGVETYFLNFANNLSGAAVAARENAASGQSMAMLPDVVKTIALNNKLDESRDFATYVQRAMVSRLSPANKTLRDLGVKQAPFVVLIGAAMPSVLAEISFLTNAQEAKLLKGSAYRQRIATALFDGIRKYQASLASMPVASLK